MIDQKLETQAFPVEYGLEVRNPKGEVISSYHGPSRSFTFNFMRIIHGFLRSTTAVLGSYRVTGTSGNTRYPGLAAAKNLLWALDGSGSLGGIVVGSSTAAVQGTDYKLGSLYSAGIGAGQFTYGKGTYINETRAGGTVTQRLQCLLTNNSGSAMRVNEIGFITGQQSMLIIRDLVGGGGNRIGTLNTLTITYDFRTLR